jgi:SAM-dependent methyltransferase
VQLVLDTIDAMPDEVAIPTFPPSAWAIWPKRWARAWMSEVWAPWEKRHESMRQGLSSDAAPAPHRARAARKAPQCLAAQEKFWAGTFGDEYTQRNRVAWQDRRSFWDLMLEKTCARSVLEVGANAGWNLLALRALDPTLKLRGVDLNPEAIKEAQAERPRRA